MTEALELPASERPHVSVLIAAYNPPTFGPCLQALARHLPDLEIEVVAVLNGPAAELRAAAREVSGLRSVEAPANLGFAGGGNLARAVAGGELLALVQDDVQIEAGWLEALLAAAEAHPEAGAIGAMAAWPENGPAQNAGVVVWADGSHTELGAGEDPDIAAAGGLRAVDTCSSNSLLVRAATWDAVGGLGDDFFPAGHVDADLAMRIRRHGQVVMSEPRARSVHVRNASTTRPYQRFIAVRNALRFRDRWNEELARSHEPPGDRGEEKIALALERAEAGRQRALARSPSTPTAAPCAAEAHPFPPDADPAAEAAAAPRLAAGLRYSERHLALRIEHAGEIEASLAYFESAVDDLRAERGRLFAELERSEQRLRAQDARLAAIVNGRWWRLRTRILALPLVGRGLRLGRGSRAAGRGGPNAHG